MEVLLEREKIQQRVRELAVEISRDYRGRTPILVGLLKGSVLFMSDLIRALTIDHEVDFVSISSYGAGTTSSGAVRLLKDLESDIGGRHVLVLEDIIDTGLSLAYIRKSLAARNPRSLAIVALLDKREQRRSDVFVDYVGFVVPDRFLVGYGLDFQERHRGLEYVAALSEAEIVAGLRKAGLPPTAPPEVGRAAIQRRSELEPPDAGKGL